MEFGTFWTTLKMDTNVKSWKAILININMLCLWKNIMGTSFQKLIRTAVTVDLTSCNRHTCFTETSFLTVKEDRSVLFWWKRSGSANGRRATWKHFMDCKLLLCCRLITPLTPLQSPLVASAHFLWIHTGILLSLYPRSCPWKDHTKDVHEQLLKHVEIWFHSQTLNSVELVCSFIKLCTVTWALCGVHTWSRRQLCLDQQQYHRTYCVSCERIYT